MCFCIFGKSGAEKRLTKLLDRIEQQLKTIVIKVNELEAQLKAIREQSEKALGEIRTAFDTLNKRIAALEEQLNAGEISEGAAAELARLKTDSQALDDIITDATPNPENAPAAGS